MDTKMNAAYRELFLMGVPVYRSPNLDLNKFHINGDTSLSDELWADYYLFGPHSDQDYTFGVHNDVIKVLEGFGMFAEWYNPEQLNVNYI